MRRLLSDYKRVLNGATTAPPRRGLQITGATIMLLGAATITARKVYDGTKWPMIKYQFWDRALHDPLVMSLYAMIAVTLLWYTLAPTVKGVLAGRRDRISARRRFEIKPTSIKQASHQPRSGEANSP